MGISIEPPAWFENISEKDKQNLGMVAVAGIGIAVTGVIWATYKWCTWKEPDHLYNAKLIETTHNESKYQDSELVDFLALIDFCNYRNLAMGDELSKAHKLGLYYLAR